MIDETTSKLRKPYQKPSFKKLTPEQAKLTLLGHATMGHKGSMDLLELMFKDMKNKKREDEEAA
jgi:hypothetical protein